MLAVAMMAPVAAADTTTVGVHTGNIDFDVDDSDYYGLNGGWTHDFSGGWTIQADGEVNSADIGADYGTSYGAVGVGLRNDTYSLYGFVGLGDVFAGSTTFYGVGGQFYTGPFVLGASYGAGESEDFIFPAIEVSQFSFDAAWYITPDIGVSAELATGEFDLGFGADADLERYGVGAVWRITGTPISLSGDWRHDELDGGIGGTLEIETLTFGVNLTFGVDTAHEQATDGPSWDGARDIYSTYMQFLP
jgi:hypothetical protein